MLRSICVRKTCWLLLLNAGMGIAAVHAQTATDSVKATIDRLFLAMQQSDSVALASCFAPGALLQTVVQDQQGTTVRNEPVSAFVTAVGKLTKGDADERIRYEVVRVDDRLAVAWTPYHFYYKGRFSHCGVNSFQLVGLAGGWKVQYIIDTRRKQGCKESSTTRR